MKRTWTMLTLILVYRVPAGDCGGKLQQWGCTKQLHARYEEMNSWNNATDRLIHSWILITKNSSWWIRLPNWFGLVSNTLRMGTVLTILTWPRCLLRLAVCTLWVVLMREFKCHQYHFCIMIYTKFVNICWITTIAIVSSSRNEPDWCEISVWGYRAVTAPPFEALGYCWFPSRTIFGRKLDPVIRLNPEGPDSLMWTLCLPCEDPDSNPGWDDGYAPPMSSNESEIRFWCSRSVRLAAGTEVFAFEVELGGQTDKAEVCRSWFIGWLTKHHGHFGFGVENHAN